MNLHPIQMEAAQQYPWSFFMVIMTGHLPHFHPLYRGGGGLITNPFFSEKGGSLERGGLFERGGLNRGLTVHVDNFIIGMKCYTF